jgi:hypothetical protein
MVRTRRLLSTDTLEGNEVIKATQGLFNGPF